MLHVAVAVIEDEKGRILISRRSEDAHQGGLWEFPGGKVETGESVAQALEREILEELGIRLTAHRPLITVTHHYNDRSVLLDVHVVTGFSGIPHGHEGQPLTWVAPERLVDYPMPAADLPIIAAIRLPSTCMITGSESLGTEHFLQRLDESLREGVGLVQLRAPGMRQQAFLDLARLAVKCCRERDALLVINGDPEWVATTGADGVHLNSRRLLALETRPLGLDKWVGASCHNAQELHQAQQLGLDFVLLSPVLPTRSHPDAQPLGWDVFQELVKSVSLPVYALGGMRKPSLEEAWHRGAQGIAGIRGWWGIQSGRCRQ
ncbi:MAG: Nudix family hydrolase [Gammaproteobacteria bacterium]|nr:Nudix family hydrolase [Gammaproteobacteria bacterium]